VAAMGQRADDDDDMPSGDAAPVGASDGPTEPVGPDHETTPDADLSRDDAPAAPEAPRPRPGLPLRLLLLVVFVNGLLAVGLLVLRPPWRVAQPDTVPALPSQVAELQARVARGEHGTPYTLTLTDDELTATARYFLAQQPDVPFAQVRLAVVDGHLEATGVTAGLAVAVPVRVVANVAAQNGAPIMTVSDVDIGGLALPSFVREQILAEANRAVDLSRYALPMTVDTITLRPGAFEARGTLK
jgi:hypothetical protein